MGATTVRKRDLFQILDVRGIPESRWFHTVGFSVDMHSESTGKVSVWIDWGLGYNPLPHDLQHDAKFNPKGYKTYGYGKHSNAIVTDKMNYGPNNDPFLKASPVGDRIGKAIYKYKKWMKEWESKKNA